MIKICSKSFLTTFFSQFDLRLVSTIATEPFLRQLLLIKTLEMEPLPLTEGVIAHHHLSKGRPTTVAVSGFFGIVFPLAFFEVLLEESLLSSLSPERVLTFLDASLLELFFQFFSRLVDEVIQFLGNIDLFPGFGFDFTLQLGDALKLMLEFMPHLNIFSFL